VTALGVTAATILVSRPIDVTGPPQTPATTAPVAPGWRLESSLGAQIEVPAHWAVNDYGCNMTDKPSVVRGPGGGRTCLTPEPSTKELAILQGTPPDIDLSGPSQATTVDGAPITRAQPASYGGRYQGWIAAPTRRVYLVVRTLDAATAERILDSFRLVDPDHLGCSAWRPPVFAQPAPSGGAFVPQDPTSISVCSYLSRDPRLQASVEVTGDAAVLLARDLNTASPGRNPDLPRDKCLETHIPEPDVVLLVRADGEVTLVWATFTYCTGRGLDNGSRQVTLNDATIHRFMQPLQSGYGFPGGATTK
jgi:hypothetical protein